ncbi:MAG: tRNA (adenosine(37)-N6)-dimethylallyltransferase MiaA [Clostridiales bacterium]|nr:tRNA (adenosine(37)-N6)-dimethylallyltransferase MiaA [Clostridiales bacterium]
MIPKIAVITGPTATGKTALGIALAKATGGEIVSADSMQIYKHMDIGTAKPDAVEMAGVKHYMLDIVSPFENYSVARYVRDAAACVDDIVKRGKLPILVGGTGLYIDSLIAGRDFSAGGDENARQELSARYDSLGGDRLLSELRRVDRESADRLHPNDKKRIVRALEIYKTTGMTITEHDERTKRLPPRYEARKIALSYADRALLYDRINGRVDTMIQKGLLNEVRKLLDMGLTRAHTAMQAIGYKEMVGVILDKESLDDAVERVKMESRRYAKRQLSWLRRDESLQWIMWGKEPDFDNGLQISTRIME